MLSIFTNEKLNKYANDYFRMLFNMMDENIEDFGHKSAFLDVFPNHLVMAEITKCKKVYNEIYSWITDEFLHTDLRPIHEYVLYSLLELQPNMESDDDKYDFTKEEKSDLEKIRETLSEEEREYLDNIYNADFYLNYFFKDNDFLFYEDFYTLFGTERFYYMRYDERIIELLPKDKRMEIEEKLKEDK